MRKLVLTLIAMALMFVAQVQVALASGTYLYQPEVPVSLKKTRN